MQNSSHSRRDRPEIKDTQQTEISGLRAKTCPLDDTTSADTMKNFVSGIVTECKRLNIRKTPCLDGEIVVIVDLLTEVIVDLERSTDEFYKISTITGIEGFCMKKYIDLQQRGG